MTAGRYLVVRTEMAQSSSWPIDPTRLDHQIVLNDIDDTQFVESEAVVFWTLFEHRFIAPAQHLKVKSHEVGAHDVGINTLKVTQPFHGVTKSFLQVVDRRGGPLGFEIFKRETVNTSRAIADRSIGYDVEVFIAFRLAISIRTETVRDGPFDGHIKSSGLGVKAHDEFWYLHDPFRHATILAAACDTRTSGDTEPGCDRANGDNESCDPHRESNVLA
jgi:hypothetical protein